MSLISGASVFPSSWSLGPHHTPCISDNFSLHRFHKHTGVQQEFPQNRCCLTIPSIYWNKAILSQYLSLALSFRGCGCGCTTYYALCSWALVSYGITECPRFVMFLYWCLQGRWFDINHSHTISVLKVVGMLSLFLLKKTFPNKTLIH